MLASYHSFSDYALSFNPLASVGVLWFAMSIGHVLADYPLQGSYLARTKSPFDRDKSLGESRFDWFFSLYAHCAIHAGMVWFLTGNIWIGLAELCLHALIDLLKIYKWFNSIVDQLFHYFCKFIYAILVVYVIQS
jgi:hypothetical protein